MASELNLIQLQDETIEQIRTAKATAVGRHIRRSLGAVSRKMERQLTAAGYSFVQIDECWKQCREMADLLDMCEE